MEGDPNDLMNTNIYIPEPNLLITNDGNDEFKRYYETEMEKRSIKKTVSLNNSVLLDEYNDNNNILTTNNVNSNVEKVGFETVEKEIQTLISIDSRDRDVKLYPNPNDFKLFIGRTFKNIKQIELVSLEFPNANPVINENNNKIYWRNQEDLDLIITTDVSGKVDIPIYSITLDTGNYTVESLQSNITSKMNQVRRRQGLRNGYILDTEVLYHNFIVSIDNITDTVSFESVNIVYPDINPISVVSGDNSITVVLNNHGFENGTKILIENSKDVGNIPASAINNTHYITVINSNSFTFTTTFFAASTILAGGGTNIRIGLYVDFQLLWDDDNINNISSNIGFLSENTSDRILLPIISMTSKLYMKIILQQGGEIRSNSSPPINMGNDVQYYDDLFIYNSRKSFELDRKFIGTVATIQNIAVGTFNLIITEVLNVREFIVEINDIEIFNSLNDINQFLVVNVIFNSYSTTLPSGIVTNLTYEYSIRLFETITDSFEIVSEENHGYLYDEILKELTLINVRNPDVFIDTSIIEGSSYIINQIPSVNKIVLKGKLSDENFTAEIPSFNSSLSTLTIPIRYIFVEPIIIDEPRYINVWTFTPHNLIKDDIIILNNVNPTVIQDYENVNINLSLTFYNIKEIISDKIFRIYEENYDPTLAISVITSGNNKSFIGTSIINVNNFKHSFVGIENIEITSDQYSITNGIVDYIYDSINYQSDNLEPYNGTTASATITPSSQTFVNNLNVNTMIQLSFFDSEQIGNTKVMTTGTYLVVSKNLTNKTFDIIDLKQTLTDLGVQSFRRGIIGFSNEFYLYGVDIKADTLGGVPKEYLNSTRFKIRKIIDENNFNFNININKEFSFAKFIEYGGGKNIYISSEKHGFTSFNTNKKNNVIVKGITLQGEDYCFLTSPQLDTILNTGDVKNIFARISLDQPPGYVCFSYLTNPKIFNQKPLSILEELQFSIVNYDGTFYNFYFLDYSFTIRITELVDETNLFNKSSTRAIQN